MYILASLKVRPESFLKSPSLHRGQTDVVALLLFFNSQNSVRQFFVPHFEHYLFQGAVVGSHLVHLKAQSANLVVEFVNIVIDRGEASIYRIETLVNAVEPLIYFIETTVHLDEALMKFLQLVEYRLQCFV